MKLSALNVVRAGALAAAAILAPSATSQTGPWTDGEILVRSELQPSGQRAIFRVIPETGATAVLTTAQQWGGWAGAMTFDSWRGGLLCNMSMPPDGTFTPRLWLVSHDGTAAAMPGFTGDLKALASAGDGRVFFIRYTGATQGPQTIEYFDAQDVIQTLKEADGVTPFQADVEHLLYDAPSNALIGCSSAQWAATHCSPIGNSLYRIPLSADGLRVDGPMTCTSIPTSLIYGDLMGLDHLPDGSVLVPTASAFLGASHGILSVDPVTLAAGTWAQPQQYDVNGGFWSARLGRAVVHANSGSAWWEPDGLRTFSAGEASYGAHIPTSLPMPVGGGYSPAEIVAEVDLNGPTCDGFQIPYGTGLAGKGGYVPLLGVIGCPDIGSLFTISINSVVGGAGGMLFVGLSPASAPFKGGTFLVGGIAAQVALVVSGTPGVAGAGSLALPAMLPSPVLAGLNLYLQAGFADAAAVKGVSLTNGVQFQGG
jgi:hypothetical protein